MQEHSFIALTTASGIVKAVQAKMAKFRYRDLTAHQAVTFGKPFTCSKMKVSRNMYMGADTALPLNSMTPTPNAPGWLRHPRPDVSEIYHTGKAKRGQITYPLTHRTN